MTSPSWPTVTPFDPAADAESAEVGSIFGGPDAETGALLLLAGPDARRDGWAARTALALATRWSEQSGTVILADASVESPELHGLLAEQNGEGVADIFQFGASLRRVRRVDPERPFEFIPAGLYAPDAEGVWRHRAWSRLVEDTLAMGRRLMVYVPADAPGVDELAERIGAVVLLAGSEADLDRQPPQADLRGVLSPVEASAALLGDAPRLRRPDAEYERIRVPRDQARESLIADLRFRQRNVVLGRRVDRADDEPRGAAPPPTSAERMPPPDPDEVLGQPDFVTSEPRGGQRRRHPLLWTLLIVLLASLIAGSWHFWLRDWLGVRAAGGTAAVTEPGNGTDAALPTGDVVPMPLSVAVEAHQDLPTARRRNAALNEAEEDIAFHIVPALVNDVVYYRILAGPVADSTAADSVLARLLDARHKTGLSGTDIQRAPLAFLIDEYDAEDAALERQQELDELDIPTYVMALARPEGPRYRLYAGGYDGRAQADLLRQLLIAAGVRDSLVQRVGSTSP